MKYAEDILKQINERGEVQVPEDCLADESFEEYLHRDLVVKGTKADIPSVGINS